MREKLSVELLKENLSFITNVTYSNVSSWYDATRRDLHMDIIAPKHRENHAPCAAVVWFCGGAFRVMDRSVWMAEMIHYAEAGFVVAGVEYRTGNEAIFPAQLIDAKAAVRFLRAHAGEFCIDPEKIFAMGESAGGAIACLLGVTGKKKELEQGAYLDQDSSVCGVIDFYGLVDMTISISEQEGDDIVPPWMLEEVLGVRYSREQAVSASALYQVTSSVSPHMILHGTNDHTVPMEQSVAYYEKLVEKGVRADLIEIEKAQHGDDLFCQNQVKDKVIAFMREYL